jgi:hypothetical protein
MEEVARRAVRWHRLIAPAGGLVLLSGLLMVIVYLPQLAIDPAASAEPTGSGPSRISALPCYRAWAA